MLKNKLVCATVAMAAACAVLPVRAQPGDHREEERREAVHEEAHHWKRGDRVPDQYRRREYVVNDWRARHLHAPPRGYQWVNVDGNFVLVAIATGIIADLALNAR